MPYIFNQTNFLFRISIILVFICVILWSFYGCVAWQKDVVLNSIHFERFVYASYRGDMIGYLAEDTVIQDYPCKATFITFYEDWTLENFQLSEPYEFGKNLLPINTWIILTKEGHIRICQFPKDTEIQGHLCKGGWGGRSGCTTGFYKNGKLKHFFSREDILIEGVPCKRGGVILHDNGRLKKCKLTEDTVRNGTKYKRNSKMNFDEEGAVVTVE
jgi:hypothetical protein